MTLKRFGVSIPEDLLEQFDKIVTEKGYIGRSEAIRDAMRLYITEHRLTEEQTGTVASLTLVYQHKPSLMTSLIEAQHHCCVDIVSTTHVHITESHCLEVMILKGANQEIQDLADQISSFSGIEYVKLTKIALDNSVSDSHHH